MDLIGIYIIVALKFLLPLLMPWCPFPAVWGNYVLDVIDGDLLGSLGLTNDTYQLLDKSADYVSYVMMLALAWRWRIRKEALYLFIYRTIGQILFFATGNEIALFYFQNFLEPLIMSYTLLLVRLKSEENAYAFYRKHLIVMWTIIVLYKLWNEYMLHFANIDLSAFLFGINGNK